ncbi:hypothetical protein F8M41_025553 [Gigaspora margarita]|uniref:Uncharacterized protein n=1 Tax=Gigaspora margarita TaxID=4874 RepID=A0A8H3XKC5_GIGMA|nr:hypothetical protein F8M41_025553 [Gigaspora margarita]
MNNLILSYEEVMDEINKDQAIYSTQFIIDTQETLRTVIQNFEEVANKFGEASIQHNVETWALQAMNDPILSFEKVVDKTGEGIIKHIIESQEILQIMNNPILSFEEMAEIEDQKKSETGELYVGKSFGSWDEVILFLNEFCKRKGFGYHKGHFKKDDEQNVKKRTFLSPFWNL